jgi:hypothetical protein
MRRIRVTWLRAALALGFCVPACNFHCGSSKVVREAPKSDAAVPNVQIQSTGKPPRVLLQVGRWTGLTYRQHLVVDSSFGISGKPPLRAPTAMTTLRYTVLRGTADPIVRRTDAGEQDLVAERGVVEALGVKSSTLPAAAVTALNQAYGKLVGTTVRQLIAEDGSVAEVRTELVGGAQTTPEIKKLLDAAWEPERSFPFRLPGVAIGVGARWTFSDPIHVQSGHAVQVADMTVLSMDAQHVKIRIRVRQYAPRQRVPNPVNPLESATLERYRGDGEGEVTFDRLTAIALSARLATTASLTLSAPGPGGRRQSATLAASSLLAEHGEVLGTSAADAGAALPVADAAAPEASAVHGAPSAQSGP